MNYFQSEQGRAAKLTGTTIEYVSFKVPKRNEGFHPEIYVDVITGEPGETLDEWLKGENKEALRKPIDKIDSTFAIKENKFEHAPSKELALKPEEEVLSLKEEIHKKDVNFKFKFFRIKFIY